MLQEKEIHEIITNFNERQKKTEKTKIRTKIFYGIVAFLTIALFLSVLTVLSIVILVS